ncbi:hypothetical protein B0H13DRAFT_2342305 [Mycena leptocephala]|nr:hypothetical protein B0H13DRAFT_2342305 [Mycena leptocephala]
MLSIFVAARHGSGPISVGYGLNVFRPVRFGEWRFCSRASSCASPKHKSEITTLKRAHSTGADIDINEDFRVFHSIPTNLSSHFKCLALDQGLHGKDLANLVGCRTTSLWASPESPAKAQTTSIVHDRLDTRQLPELEDVAINWTETWTNSTSASLSVSNRAGVSLSQSISIMGVAGSEFSFDISTESTSEETQQNSRQLSATWAIVVRAGETVHLERIRTIRQGQATYHQDYGWSPNSLMAAQGGHKFNSHNDFTFNADGVLVLLVARSLHWWVLLLPKPQTITKLNPTGFNINSTLNNPRGTMALRGRSSDEAFTFRIIRTASRTVEPLPPPEGKNPIVRMSEECGAKFPTWFQGWRKRATKRSVTS